MLLGSYPGVVAIASTSPVLTFMTIAVPLRAPVALTCDEIAFCASNCISLSIVSV